MALKGYVTPEEVAVLMGMDASDSALLSQIEVALEIVEDEVDAYCETTFQNEVGVTKSFSGTGQNMITLGSYLRNVTSIQSLDWDYTTGQYRDQYETLTDVVLQPSPNRHGVYRWIERRGGLMFPIGMGNISITGDWGFVTVPGAIKQAIALNVRHFFNLRTMDTTKVQESSINRNVEFVSHRSIHFLHPVAKLLLDKYKNSTWMS